MSGIAKIYEGFNDGKYEPVCLSRNGSNYFYYFANLWLNAVVAHQVYRLVVSSHQRRKASPPTMRTALKQIAAVYFFCGLVAAWFIAEVPWSPYMTTDRVYCHTNVGSEAIGKWMATGIALMIMAPPFVYVTYVYWVIWRKKLLPTSGRTRALFVYFLRILIVYYVFYMPNACLAVAYMNIPNSYRTAQFWTLWGFTVLVPFQCIVTIRMACAKQDIGQAVSNTRKEMVRGVSKRVSTHFTHHTSSASFKLSEGASNSGNNPSSSLQHSNKGGPSETSASLPPVVVDSTNVDSDETGIGGVPITSEWDLDDTYDESKGRDEEHASSKIYETAKA